MGCQTDHQVIANRRNSEPCCLQVFVSLLILSVGKNISIL